MDLVDRRLIDLVGRTMDLVTLIAVLVPNEICDEHHHEGVPQICTEIWSQKKYRSYR